MWRCGCAPRGREGASRPGSHRVKAILALDQGTTGSTALVVGADGAVLGRGYRELPQYYPQPGWVEHEPAELWATQLDAARAALAAARVAPRDVAAIGITNQRETTLLWDRRTGVPVHRAIVWQCRRSAPICERLQAEGLEPVVRARTGLEIGRASCRKEGRARWGAGQRKE